MNDIDLKQGSIEWKLARAGSLGAASVHDALAKLKKGGWAASRERTMERLMAERLSGIPASGFMPAGRSGCSRRLGSCG